MLFTAPGERVNRPDFGSGLMQLVFAPNSDELAAATQFLVQGALQQWLGDLIRGRVGPGGKRGRDAAGDDSVRRSGARQTRADGRVHAAEGCGA